MGMRIGPRRRDRVSALLAAACAPAHPDELAGEDAAVAAYRAAAAAPPSAATAHRGTARRLTAGVATWLAAVTTTAVVGAAVATAAVIHEPSAPHPGAQPTTPTTAASPRTPAADPGERVERPGPDATRTTTSGSLTGRAVDAPPGIAGLCRAYLAKKPAQREKMLAKPHFAPLVAAADGAGQVAAYCDEVLAAEPGGTGESGPADQATPAEKPKKGKEKKEEG